MGGIKRNEGIHRHDISGEAWDTDKELLPGQAEKRGGCGKDKRLFIDTHERPVERHTARIREPKQHA